MIKFVDWGCDRLDDRSCQMLQVLTADAGSAFASRTGGVAVQGMQAQFLPSWIAAPKPACDDGRHIGLAGQRLRWLVLEAQP